MNEVIEIIPRGDTEIRFEEVEIIEDGRAIGILLMESDGTISAVRIGIEQIAD